MVIYEDPNARIIQGDALEVLREMPKQSVHCCVTSPPYWGLRKYSGEQERVWGGDPECEHKWGTVIPNPMRKSGKHGPASIVAEGTKIAEHEVRIDSNQGRFCQKCGAWRGAFGLEPTIEMYIEHTLVFLRAIKQVLRKDGVVFWNIGDSYAGSGCGTNDYRTPDSISLSRPKLYNGSRPQNKVLDIGLKALDLCLIPQRVALAAQQDGWWVRSMIVWNKPNPMPESVGSWRWERCRVKVKAGSIARMGDPSESGVRSFTNDHGKMERIGLAQWADCPGCPKCLPNDGLVLRKGSWRPTSSYEYILMLTKTANYFCDGEAVREIAIRAGDIPGGNKHGLGEYGVSAGWAGGEVPAGRNLRDVWTFPTQPFGYEMCIACHILYTSAQYHHLPRGKTVRCQHLITAEDRCGGTKWVHEHGRHECLSCGATYSPSQFAKLPTAAVCRCGRDDSWLSHFATFPEELVKRCILASTPEHGVCAQCGAPYARVIVKGQWESHQQPSMAAQDVAGSPMYRGGGHHNDGLPYREAETQTLGWRKTCKCQTEERVAATVLDPFAGSGTSVAVAKGLGRIGTGIDISDDYCQLAAKRIAAVNLPMRI